MSAGSPASQRSRKLHGKGNFGSKGTSSGCLRLTLFASCSFMHMFTSTFQVPTPEIVIAVQLAAIVLAIFIALSVVWKGVVPLIICVLGIVLMHNSIILPYYAEPNTGQASFGGTPVVRTLYTPEAVSTAEKMHFVLDVWSVEGTMTSGALDYELNYVVLSHSRAPVVESDIQ